MGPDRRARGQVRTCPEPTDAAAQRLHSSESEDSISIGIDEEEEDETRGGGRLLLLGSKAALPRCREVPPMYPGLAFGAVG